jgi:hypothetical protein
MLETEMQKIFFALSLGFAGLILATQNAFAASQCGPRDQVVSVLGQKYSETRHGIGLNGPGQVMELYVNPTTGTWTILITLPAGETCLVASGEHYEALTEALPAKGDPT